MATTTCELVWICGILHDVGVSFTQPATLYCDNKTALHIATNPMYHERTKYIEIDCHLVGEKIKQGFIQTAHIPSVEQLADIFTKSLGTDQHRYLLSKLGTRNLYQA